MNRKNTLQFVTISFLILITNQTFAQIKEYRDMTIDNQTFQSVRNQ